MNAAQPAIGQRDWKVMSAALLMLAAGMIHFLIIPHHWEHAPAHGIMMAAIGVLEITWALLYRLRPSKTMAQSGAVLAISVICLWAFTRFVPAPFTNEVEEVDFSGLLSKALEAISAAVLLAVVASAAPSDSLGRPKVQGIFTILLISIMLTAAVYQAARAAQPLFPQLSSHEIEAPGEEHGH